MHFTTYIYMYTLLHHTVLQLKDEGYIFILEHNGEGCISMKALILLSVLPLSSEGSLSWNACCDTGPLLLRFNEKQGTEEQAGFDPHGLAMEKLSPISAVVWLIYYLYGVKPYSINSINQSINSHLTL